MAGKFDALLTKIAVSLTRKEVTHLLQNIYRVKDDIDKIEYVLKKTRSPKLREYKKLRDDLADAIIDMIAFLTNRDSLEIAAKVPETKTAFLKSSGEIDWQEVRLLIKQMFGMKDEIEVLEYVLRTKNSPLYQEYKKIYEPLAENIVDMTAFLNKATRAAR